MAYPRQLGSCRSSSAIPSIRCARDRFLTTVIGKKQANVVHVLGTLPIRQAVSVPQLLQPTMSFSPLVRSTVAPVIQPPSFPRGPPHQKAWPLSQCFHNPALGCEWRGATERSFGLGLCAIGSRCGGTSSPIRRCGRAPRACSSRFVSAPTRGPWWMITRLATLCL